MLNDDPDAYLSDLANVPMAIVNAIASVAVTDVRAAASWYGTLFGREPDSVPMPEVAEWKFDRGGWLQVYQAPERAGDGSCTLAVTDIEDVANRLDQQGIDIAQRTSSDKVKTIMIVDPDGNHIAFAQTSDTSMAR